MSVQIGCDPEFFVRSKTRNSFVSAHDLFPGTKQEPFKVILGAVQVDGVAFEFNIEPAKSLEDFLRNIETVTNTMKHFARRVDPDLEIVVTPTASFDKDYFDSLPLYAKNLGCEPDYNAYTGKENTRPETQEPFRTGSGHVHVGWTEYENSNDTSHFYDCIEMTKQLDMALFPVSLLWDDDRKRRELYGRVGAFRPKHYGVEYRVLSNVWASDPDLAAWVYGATRRAEELLHQESCRLYRDKDLNYYFETLKEGGELPRRELEKYHDILSISFDFPSLPEEFITDL